MSILEQLEKYQEHFYKLASINDDIENLEISIDAIGGFSNDGMPRGTNTSRPTERKAIALVEKKRELEDEARKIIQHMERIEAIISGIEDSRVRYIVRAKYISFKGFEDIGMRCQPKISGKHVKRLHDKGIQELERKRREVNKCRNT